MMPSPLIIEEYFLTDLRVTANPSTQEAEVEGGGGDLAIESSVKRDGERWICSLTIALADHSKPRAPYAFRISLTGVFLPAPGYPEDGVEQMMNLNAPTVLYGSARELLATVTGRGPFPAVLLPSVSFYRPPKPQTGETVSGRSGAKDAHATPKHQKRVPVRKR